MTISLGFNLRIHSTALSGRHAEWSALQAATSQLCRKSLCQVSFLSDFPLLPLERNQSILLKEKPDGRS
ncbi:hypothetical protein KEF85_03345 [Methylomonas paludis]|uniref:Uncharacterized protein n=1 Tax=Methylomonas paludis TaxID=1173101 RepID=A0A975MP99_9GAMM|nr:hypothetical protein [Methylomonas paludis]QWF71528.1 hypothetical protein KEF85_03345 [Methylomonas paludis]